ncbi:hypothetical protein [Streptomyces flavidovirens]|uniref:hypothetical protein n=1 Tax=Streptomyces flavidovirens TaxID=67298 RepID=UPI000417B8B4|nr:hypothetical protein [Streptomyces flavidovirens]
MNQPWPHHRDHDPSRQPGHRGFNLGTLLRQDGHRNIAAALAHHARDTGRPINLVLTS